MNLGIEQTYQKHKNLKLAAAELGIKWQTLYCQLRKLGIPVTGDKLRYGNDKDRLAASAENEFKRLVPMAKSQNDIRFQSKIDFIVGNEKIDIKSATLRQGNKKHPQLRWAFSVKKQETIADFIVCFAYLDDGYKLFLIPGEIVRKYQTISISPSGKSKWLQYEITPDDLSAFFDDLQGGIERGTSAHLS